MAGWLDLTGWTVRRQLSATARRLQAAKRELVVLTEQVEHFDTDAEADEVRALVSDHPEAAGMSRDSSRHAASHRRQRDAVIATIAELEHHQDELLDRLNAATGRA